MRAYVITLLNLPESVDVAQRCIESGKEFGVNVEMFGAVTPDEIDRCTDVNPDCFEGSDRYSRRDAVVATFISHRCVWNMAVVYREPVLVLEHDAVFVASLPDLSGVHGLCNLGKPSFGQFVTPRDGLGPLVSKAGGYLGGAHAYYVTPRGAGQLIDKSKTEAEAADIYLNTKRFPWMQEYHPWPIECDDSFSTIQNEEGCKAKHNEVRPL